MSDIVRSDTGNSLTADTDQISPRHSPHTKVQFIATKGSRLSVFLLIAARRIRLAYIKFKSDLDRCASSAQNLEVSIDTVILSKSRSF